MVLYFAVCTVLVGMTHLLSAEEEIRRFQFSERLMGTDVQITIDALEGDNPEPAAKAAFKEGNRLNKIFSDWDADSEVSRFSRSSQSDQSFKMSKELFEVLAYSQELAHKSKGAFDITIGPLSRLWRMARHQGKLPEKKKIEATIERTGFRKLVLQEEQISGKLLQRGMVLDMGGIAKGYIADRMLEVLKKNGFPRCLIDAGGDLTLGEPPRTQKGWRVQIGGISNSQIPPLELSNCAIATSGDLEQFLQFEGKRYSHLIDPRNGYAIEGGSQVTIIAPNGIAADAHASTCLILGIQESRALLFSLGNFSFYYLKKADSALGVEIYELHNQDTE